MLRHIPDEAADGNIGILGKVGSGKTTVGKLLAEQKLRDDRRLCVLDPTGVWWGLASSADGKKPGFPVVVFGGAHADVQINEAAAGALGKLVAETASLRSVIDLSELTLSARTRFATAFFDALYHRNRRPLYLILDEADLFAPQRPMPDQTTMFNRVEQIIRRGRVRGFRATLITQRPAELHKSVLSQCGTIVAMKLVSPQDRNALGAWIEGQASKEEGKEILAMLPKLRVGEGYLWCPEISLLERKQFPMPSTFDSSRTPEEGDESAEPKKATAVDLAAIRATLEDAMIPKEKRGAKAPKLPPAGPDWAAAIAKAREEARKEGIAEGIRQAFGFLAKARVHVGAAQESLAQVMTELGKLQVPVGVPAAAPSPVASNPKQPKAAPPQPQRVAPPPRDNVVPLHGLARPEQDILDALAWFESVGIGQVDRSQLAPMVRRSSKSSGFKNLLGRLRSAGRIDYPAEGRMVFLTDGGRALARAPAGTPTDEELHARIEAGIGSAKWAIVRALIEVHPMSLSREALAEAVQRSPLSSGFKNLLGSLHTLGFVDYPERGTVRAGGILFIGGPDGQAVEH